MNPIHDPDRDEPMDFSDIAEFNPSRIPLPGQAHAITATVKGLKAGSKGGFNNGEMGVGKSLMAAVSAYKYCNGVGRVLVMCPDHTIDKWADEIRGTIPNCRVLTFQSWKEVVRYSWTIADDSARGPKRWKQPAGMEYVIVGRDQSKRLPACPNMGEEKNCFDGKRRSKGGATRRVIGHQDAKDEAGNFIFDEATGRVKREPIFAEIYRCPACGSMVIDRKKSIPINVAASKDGICCSGRYAVELGSDGTTQGRDRILLTGSAFADAPAGKIVRLDHIWSSRDRLIDPHKKYVVKVCNEPLWNYVRKPDWWAPAWFIHKKMRGCFRMAILDEVHECKALDTDQAVAAGKLMASAEKVLMLTGTIIGGYAWHLFPILYRTRPAGLVREGIRWGQTTEFSRKYGRVARIVTVTQEGDGSSGSVRGRRSASMRRIRSGSRQSERPKIEPGVMPSLYARHLAGCSVFLSMADLASAMPPFHEYIGCSEGAEDQVWDGKDPYWTNTAVDMEPEQAKETERITEICKATCNDLLKKGSIKFLSMTLVATMEYPDHPFGWYSDFEDEEVPSLLGQSFLKNFDYRFDPEKNTLSLSREGATEVVQLRKEESGVYTIDVTFNGKHTVPMIYDTGASNLSIGRPTSEELGLVPKADDYDVKMQIADGSTVPARVTKVDSVKVGGFTLHGVECCIKSSGVHSVGYWHKPKIRTKDNWCGVVTPKDLPRDVVYPKEKKLIEICKREVSAGNQVWVFANMTGKRDVQPRLASLLEAEGLKTGILRARNVKPRDRIEWIEKNCKNVNVMFSHPQPVMTGLDLLSKAPGGHNFNSIVFYQTGTKAFVCKQASRRGWRLIQDKRCRVYYLYYRNTVQHHFISMMAKKFAAMATIGGDFTAEGLIAMGGGDDGALALCQSIGNVLDDSLIRANWEKAKGSFGDMSDASGVLGKNRCEITVEDLRAWDRVSKQAAAEQGPEVSDLFLEAADIESETPIAVGAEPPKFLEDFTPEEIEAASEPLVEEVEFNFDEDGWLTLSEDELALLNF